MKRLLTSLVLLTSLNAHGLEPLKDSSQAVMQAQAQRLLDKSDTNKDGTIQPDEDAVLWKKHARLDQNKDGALDLAELKKINSTHIDSPGKKLLNVLYKRTPRGGVYLDFYFPDQDTRRDKPVVLFTHGGGWAAGNKSKAGVGSFNVVHRALLEKGYCVASVGYRKVNKQGDTAVRDCVIDSQDALRYLSAYHKELGIDPNKCYTFGDSAGGHLAQMVLFAPQDGVMAGDPELAQYGYQTVAGVSWYGPCDFQDIQLFNHDGRENFTDRFNARIMGGNTGPKDKAQRYREISPISYLTPDSPPLLLIQGDRDTTIPVKQAYRMQEALKTIDAPVQVLIVKNAGHNWRPVGAPIEPTREEIVARTIAFLLEN